MLKGDKVQRKKILSEVMQSQIRKSLILHLLFAISFFSILCIGHIGKITKSCRKKHLKALTIFTLSSA